MVGEEEGCVCVCVCVCVCPQSGGLSEIDDPDSRDAGRPSSPALIYSSIRPPLTCTPLPSSGVGESIPWLSFFFFREGDLFCPIQFSAVAIDMIVSRMYDI